MPTLSDIALLDYDHDRADLLSSFDIDHPEQPFPQRAVLAILGKAVDAYVAEHSLTRIGTFSSVSNDLPIYRGEHNGVDFALVATPVGAPAAIMLMHWMINNGVKTVIATGSCGALVDFGENEFLLPTKALRDEGTSYAYLPASRWIEITPRITQCCRDAIVAAQLKAHDCVTWTTDGLFRETKSRIANRVVEGCTVVDMECSAFAACAQFLGAEFGQILFTADSLANLESYDPRGWGKDSHRGALEITIDAISRT
ncbi:MAG: nucleoside phosphorylase [Propionibacteriaceae bacterium]